MSYINTSNGVSIWINGVDYTQYLIEGSLSDSSVYSSNIVTTNGEIKLGTTEAILDFDKTSIPIGSRIDLWTLLDNGNTAKHPKGALYVINSSSNLQDLTLTLEVGCSLAFLSEKEGLYANNVKSLFETMLTSSDRELLLIEEYSLANLNSYLDCLGKILYQDKWGYIQKVDVFGNDGFGGGLSGSKLTSFDKHTAIAIDSLSSTAVENDIAAVTVDARVDVPVLTPKDPSEEGIAVASGLNPALNSVSHASSVAVGSAVNFTVSTTDIEEGSTVTYTAKISQNKLDSRRSFRLRVDENGNIQFSIKIASEAKFNTTSNPNANKFTVSFKANVKLQNPGPSATLEEKQAYDERIKSLTLESGEITITGFTVGEDEDGQDFVPEPFISSILFRQIQIPSVYGGYIITQEPDAEAALTDNTNPLTGSLNEPAPFAPPNQLDYAREQLDITNVHQVEFPPVEEAEDVYADPRTGVGYSWHIRGEVGVTEKTITEKVVSGRSITYNKNNRQVLKEINFEWTSAATYAKEANGRAAKEILDYIGYIVERSNNLLQKANQCYDERDKFKMTVVYESAGGATNYANSTYYYWQYQGDAFYNEARLSLKKIDRLRTELTRVLNETNDIYYLSNATIRENSYDERGRLYKETVTAYVHPLRLPDAESYKITIEGNLLPTEPLGVAYSGATTVALETLQNLRIEIKENNFKRLKQDAPSSESSLDAQIQNLKAINQNVTTYNYGTTYIAKEEKFRDFYDGSKDYRRINYSSTGSTSPELPDRIIEDVTAENATVFEDIPADTPNPSVGFGVTIPDTFGGWISTSEGISTGTQYCNEETEDHDISATVLTKSSVNPSLPVSWFGQPTARTKKVTFPLEFIPIKSTYDPDTEICDLSFNPTDRLKKYELLVKRYAYNIARKIKGDNTGFRVTEKMRPEVYGYYPFYPVNISLESINAGYKARVASSTWVFNQQESICSFDCLSIGKISSISFPNDADVSDLLEDLYPIDSTLIVTASNYIADAGEFTDGTTNGGFNAGGGDFDAGTAELGIERLNSGDFDTGTDVILPPPVLPATASTENGDTDPEVEEGVDLLDETGSTVDVTTLPTTTGTITDLSPIDVEFKAVLSVLFDFDFTISPSISWNFGSILVELDSSYDAGTIATPTALGLDFGTITNPLTPVLSSYVA